MLGSLQSFRRRLLAWYSGNQRDLPWRAAGSAQLDPYHVLVSETMLQQTQVATVIPYYHRFLERFPNPAALAEADEQQVLRLWQGLGYYSRARNLRRAAQRIVAEHGGKVPDRLDQLLMLPGVGRYTAGAVASIAFGKRAPILDGNVQRVLCRLDAIRGDPRERTVNQTLWNRAEEILPQKGVGDFNSALMELGATVCTPRGPRCLTCPVKDHCAASAKGVQEQIPPPRKAKQIPLVLRQTYCIQNRGRWLIEQRSATGRWAGMWQFVTIDPKQKGDPQQNGAAGLPCAISKPKLIGHIAHTLTHRQYKFEVFTCNAKSENLPPGAAARNWVTLDTLDDFPLPVPHLRIAQLLRRHMPASRPILEMGGSYRISDRPTKRVADSSSAGEQGQ
ncbi:MAG TPA: A/G-specific adenine glycosylase [Humisphaera sp.]|nr:A/G-specific adenine glycosylase [Humisphaera sp.]